jgi:hypothetical protein
MNQSIIKTRSHIGQYFAYYRLHVALCVFASQQISCSYQSGSVNLVTPVSSEVLSAINHALAGLDGMPTQVLPAMNRKLRKKSCTPKLGHAAHFLKEGILSKLSRKCTRS